jgi:hypothetical protein
MCADLGPSSDILEDGFPNPLIRDFVFEFDPALDSEFLTRGAEVDAVAVAVVVSALPVEFRGCACDDTPLGEDFDDFG